MEMMGLFFVACALSGIAIPMPEDIAILAAGTTIEDPWMFAGYTVAGIAGLICRDSVFFGVGHLMGEGLLTRAWVLRFFGEGRIEKGRALVEARGGRAVLGARVLVGFRSTGFLVAGALGVRPRDFLLWDMVGLVVSVPAVLLLGLLLGDPITAAVWWVLDHKVWVLVGLVVGGLAWFGVRLWRQREVA